MARRILITLCAAALGVAAWWIVRPGSSVDEGLVVHVRVQDQDGNALTGAQVQAVFRSPTLHGWSMRLYGSAPDQHRLPSQLFFPPLRLVPPPSVDPEVWFEKPFRL